MVFPINILVILIENHAYICNSGLEPRLGQGWQLNPPPPTLSSPFLKLSPPNAPSHYPIHSDTSGGHCGHDRMVVGFTTTYAFSAYHNWCCEFKSRSGRGVQHNVTGQWFSLGSPVSSTNKTDCHDVTEILLKVALNTIKQTNKQTNWHICRVGIA